MPTAIAQNINTTSLVSLTVVQKRIMLKAPIVPSESATLELIGITTNVTMSAVSTMLILKARLYITPVNVFRYMKKRNNPIAKLMVRERITLSMVIDG